MTTKTGFIYRINFPNGKSYIGQTVQIPSKRLRAHINCSKNNKSKHYHSKLSRALRKYDELYNLDVLYDNVPLGLLDNMESWMIASHNSVDFGYNTESGGSARKTFCHSEETKEKIRQHKLGRKLSKEHKQKISNAINANHPFLGRKHSEETKLLISLNHGMKGKHHTDDSRKKMSESRLGKKRGSYKKNSSPIFPI